MNCEDHKEGELTVRTYEDGTKQWLLNDKLHREDGPAIECVSGTKEWWLNGNCEYNYNTNYLKFFSDLSEQFKRSVIKYELQRK